MSDLDGCYLAFADEDPYCWFCRGVCSWTGVCLGILCPSTPAVLSLILLTLMHGDEELCDAGLGVISFVYPMAWYSGCRPLKKVFLVWYSKSPGQNMKW